MIFRILYGMRMANNSTTLRTQSWYDSFTWPHVMSIWGNDSVFFDGFLLDIGFSQRRVSNVEYSDTALIGMLCELIRPKLVILSQIKTYICFWWILCSLFFYFCFFLILHCNLSIPLLLSSQSFPLCYYILKE